MAETEDVLNNKQPSRIVIFGGDCSVTQVPFDYLKSKYEDKLGILWFDAHPDVAGPKDSSHLHEMVLANLLGQNPSSAIIKVQHPFKPSEVMLVGLIEEDLREMDMACMELNLKIVAPAELKASSQPILDWLEENNIEYLAVHWDLDVLSPDDFRAILTAMPYLDIATFPAAVGRMTLNEIGRILNDIAEKAEIVGLGITEYMPWDAMNLRKVLSSLPIFNS